MLSLRNDENHTSDLLSSTRLQALRTIKNLPPLKAPPPRASTMNGFRQDLLHSLDSLSLFQAILVVYSYLTEMIFQLLMNQSNKEMLGSGDGPEMGVQPPLVPSLVKQASQLFEIDIDI
jgi:hypothetical protein